MNISVVVALSRPERLNFIIDNFNKQKYKNSNLILVLNGRASSITPIQNDRIISIISETGNPARPRNKGLEYIRNSSIPLITFWDDDDYYGEDYLSEMVTVLQKDSNSFVGKYARYTQFDDGIYFLEGKQESFLGGTMGGWVNTLPNIPDLPNSEDLIWFRNLKNIGLNPIPLSHYHYLYNRTGNEHAWHSTKVQILYSYGPAKYIGDVDISVINHDPIGNYVPEITIDDIEKDLVERQYQRLVDLGEIK